jgi:iron complex transport system substrate-binding protein
VYALGLEDDLVGVTFECDWPPSARTAHRVVVTGLDTEAMSPGEIDDVVRARVATGDGLYRLDTTALRNLEPDLVVTQDLCRVCALPSHDAVVALQRVANPSRVLTIDAGGYVVRPGPRLVDGVEALPWALHGEVLAPPRDGIMRRIR